MERLMDVAPLLLAGIAAGLAVLFVVDRYSARREFVVGSLFLSQGLIPALATIAGAAAGLNVIEGAAPVGAKLWLLRLGTLALISAVGVGLLRASARRTRLPRNGRSLWAGALGFVMAMLVSDLVNGSFEQSTVLFALGLTVLLLAPRVDPAFIATIVKGICGLYFVAAAAAALLGWPGAFGPFSNSLLPGINFRFQGAMSHANDLGVVTVLYMIMEYAHPSPRWLRWAGLSSAVTLLALSQSKTSWAAGAFVAVVQWAGGPPRRRNARLAILVMAAGALVVSAALLVNVVGLDRGAVITPEQLENARTLTGRTRVWAAGLEVWRENPILGGGPNVFPEYAESTGQLWAGQAHNQVIGTLAEAGLVGLAALLTYVVVLVRYARRHALATHYASVSLVGLMLIRSLTETPVDAFNLLHVTMYTMLLAWEAQASRAPAAPAVEPRALERPPVPSARVRSAPATAP